MPYNRNRNHGVEPTLSDNQRQLSVEHKQDLPDWLSINTNTDSRHYSASDESEDSTSYYRQELLKHVSHNVDDEKDGDVPYVIGQFQSIKNLLTQQENSALLLGLCIQLRLIHKRFLVF